MLRYVCLDCGYIYDPKNGDPTQDIPPGTPGQDLPEAWTCPKCQAKQSHFAISDDEE